MRRSSSYSAAICGQSISSATGRLGMQGGDRRLDLVAARAPEPQRAVQHAHALGDLGPVPARAILVGEQDQLAVGVGPRVPARIVEQHQREQTERLWLSGINEASSLPSRTASAHRSHRTQVRAGGGGVALVEDQVDDREHGRQPLGQGGVARQLERDPGVANLALGAHQALGHRGVGHEEGPRDLGPGQPAYGLEGQRHPGLGRQRRMTAGEQQAEPLVADLGEAVGHRIDRIRGLLRDRIQTLVGGARPRAGAAGRWRGCAPP